jgi:outer membrane protein assembly factor BamD (BamD/ComL family)
MAENRSGARKHVLFYVALLACLSISSCAGWRVEKVAPEQGAREHLAGGQKALVRHDYQTSLQELEVALSLSGNRPPGDEALFNMGMVYGDPENPRRDYPKSIASFQRLGEEYPQSTWAESARIWTQTLKEQERLKRVMFETLQENERLKRLSNETAQENQRLKQIVKRSKTVDIEVDRKKRDQGL